MDSQQTPLTITCDSEADVKTAEDIVSDRQETAHRRRRLYGVCAAAIVSVVAVCLLGRSRSYGGDNVQMTGFMSADNTENSAKVCEKDAACKLKLSSVTSDNLLGTDKSKPPELRYGNVCTLHGKQIDMVVTASHGFEGKPGKSGLSGKFGQLNMKSGTSATFTFRFSEHGTDTPVKPDSIKFSVLDFDGIGEHSEKTFEKATFTGFSSYTLGKGSKLKEEAVKGGVAITSTEAAQDGDNPTDPMTLTSKQQQRSISLVYTNVEAFSMKFEIGGTYLKGYRNFMFAGESAVKGVCKPPPPQKCTPTVWMSAGPKTVCRLSKSDETLDAQGSVVVTTTPNLDACKEKCANYSPRCYGVEWAAEVRGKTENRCEIWTKPATHVDKCDANTKPWDKGCKGSFECLGFWCKDEADKIKKKLAEQNKIADR